MTVSSASTNKGARAQVMQLLVMRHMIQPQASLRLLDDWLQNNPNESAVSLKRYLQTNKVLVLNDAIVDLRHMPQQQLEQIAETLHGPEGVEVKDRWHRARQYPRCFIGSEAVTRLQSLYSISLAEAIRYGQLLVENGFIHHVTGQHLFENEFLFYRFQQDAVPEA